MQTVGDFQRGLSLARCGHWGGSILAFERCLDSAGPHAAILHNLALANWQLARNTSALRCWRDACLLAPCDPLYPDMLRSLEAWITACESEPDPLLTDCVRLFATPLGPHHSRAVFAFTRDDASLRQSAGLPEFDSPSEVRAWVKWQRHARGATVSALVEPQEHGPIGAITLTDDGYFSYWIGTPHQRKGYGRLALQLLVQLASRRRVGRLHSYVESGNDASRRALAASGFVLVGGGDSGWTGQLEYSMEVAYAI